MTLYEIMFGKIPPIIPQYIVGTSSVNAVDDFLINREELFASLRKKLLKAQQTMKHFADNKRRDVSFQVGHWVFVKLQPRRQVSVTGASHSKLTKRYFGPFQIIQKVGPVAYQLQLPADSRIHPVFHCSFLKPCHQLSDSPSITAELPPSSINNDPIISSLAILSTKWETLEHTPKLWVLVQWKGLHPNDATRESWEELKVEYHLEDKVFFKGHENVMNGKQEAPQLQPTPVETQPEQTVDTNQRQRGVVNKSQYLKDFV